LQVLLGKLYLQAERLDDAAQVMTRATEAFPTSPEAPALASQALGLANRWPEAMALAREWRRRDVANPLPADLRIAGASVAMGQAKAGVEQLQPHVDRWEGAGRPDDQILVVAAYGECMVVAREVDRAATLLGPQLQWRSVWIGLAANRVPYPPVAAQWLQKVAAMIPPSDLGQRVELAAAWHGLWLRGQYPEAHTAAKAAVANVVGSLAAAPDAQQLARPIETLGMLLEAEGQWDAAEAAYRRVLRIDPTSLIAMNNLAMLLVNKQGAGKAELSQAMALAAQAANLQPRQGSFLDTLAAVQLKSGEPAQAVVSLNRALRLKPDNVGWRVNLGLALLAAGERVKAKESLDRVEAMQLKEEQLRPDVRDGLNKLRGRLRTNAASTR
jgi:tetratricopeptide (TPR) repeat protein